MRRPRQLDGLERTAQGEAADVEKNQNHQNQSPFAVGVEGIEPSASTV